MIKPIVKDEFFLAQKSEPATQEDISIGQALIDTLIANNDRCVGMAANMIGIKKRIIIVDMGIMKMVMFNPKIVKRSDPYQTEEGCLSLVGVRNTTRYRNIDVEYRDMTWKKQRNTFRDHIAQIIQHEMDHCNGIII